MNLISYHIEVVICLSIFFIIYYLFLRYETFFNINRYILIVAVILSFTIPLIEMPTENVVTQYVTPIQIESQINEITVYAQKSKQETFDYLQLIPIIYFGGVMISFLKIIIGLFKLYSIRKYSKIMSIDRIKIFVTDKDVNPFTFMNTIFLSKKTLDDQNYLSIFRHELVHKNQRHSIDIFVMEIFKSLQWFNPIIFLIDRELREVHEYIADSNAIKYEEKSNYVDILLNLTFGAQVSDLANNFKGIKLIKRLKMIAKPKSPKSAVLKYLMILPAILILFVAFSCKENIVEKQIEGNEYKDIYPMTVYSGEMKKEYYKEDNNKKIVVDGLPYQRDKFIDDKLLNHIKLHSTYLNEENAMMVIFKLKVGIDGIGREPIIIEYKYYDDKYWYKQQLPREIEKDLLQAFTKEKILYQSAHIKGKLVESYEYISLVIGDKNLWNEYNAYGLGVEICKRYPTGNQTRIIVPTSNANNVTKVGKCLFTNEQLDNLNNNLKYPEEARKNNIEGTVIVDFKIDSKGNVIDAKIEKGIGFGCDEEALRVVKELKNFDLNKKFDSQVSLKLPIKFMLK